MISLGEVVIIGGGCYGGFYLGQLAKASQAGATEWDRLLVVDRDPECAAAAAVSEVAGAELEVSDWGEFLREWLIDRGERDRIVPSPLMPHLLADWVAERARERWSDREVALRPVVEPVGTPYDELHPGTGVRYLSHADWLCPVHCIEPGICPRIKAPRSWEMSRTIEQYADSLALQGTPTIAGLFKCQHVTHGVGMIDAGTPAAALGLLDQLLTGNPSAPTVRIMLASISSCHGALAALEVSTREQ